MTDAEWAVVRDAMPVPAWLEGRGGQQEGYCHRQLVDALRYLVAGGIAWRAVPADFPAWDRVYAFFRRWRDKVLVAEFHDRLRDRVREAEGRDPEPTAGIIDAQSVKGAASVPTASRGFDSGKKVNGRKRHIVVDALGLLLAVMVTAASVTDREAGRTLLERLRERHWRISLVWVDGGCTGRLVDLARDVLRIALTVVRRTDDTTASWCCREAGGTDIRMADALTLPGPRLRDPHRHLRGGDPVVDVHGHEPPTRPANTLNIPGRSSAGQPRTTRCFTFDRTPSTFAATTSRSKAAASCRQSISCPLPARTSTSRWQSGASESGASPSLQARTTDPGTAEATRAGRSPATSADGASSPAGGSARTSATV
ncbi:IS5 family transposase [Streptomyces sp. NPDC058291]|uniref:IS5 family transposase n=1 Tax=Streptomyces sp. NPDC058291 TaxID=3346427 RepID=UPI0036EB4F93